jgi:phosphoglycolate phosphatase
MSAALAQDPALVLFDLDGTLVATAPDICDAVNATLEQSGLPPVRQEQVEAWLGQGTRELLAQALAFARETSVAQARRSPDFALDAIRFDDHYQQRCGARSQLYPHVCEVLAELRRRAVKLAVVTNKEERFTRTVLARHGLSALLDRVVSGDSLPARKPDPAGLLACMKAFDVPAARTLFVGDSAIDVAAARNAGVPVWAVTYGYNMGQPIARHAPDRLLADLRPLLDPSPGDSSPWH